MSMGKENSATALKMLKSDSVKAKVIRALNEFTYCSRRQLHNITGIEIATLCGALASLKKAGTIREAMSAECGQTGKDVIYYALNTEALA